MIENQPGPQVSTMLDTNRELDPDKKSHHLVDCAATAPAGLKLDDLRVGGRSSGWMVSEEAKAAARSRTFSSSRTLPGHG